MSTSERLGTLVWAPARVTESAAAALAKRPALSGCCPSERATANAPFQTSPAATVSTGSTLKADQACCLSPSIHSAPAAPRLDDDLFDTALL